MNSMNEDTVRTLLADVAAVPGPPSRISIEAARKTGRRRQWAARALASVAVAAVAVGGALVIPRLGFAAAPVGPTGTAVGARPAAHMKPAAPAAAPARFDPLELSANFGWLPSFWNEEGASVEETPTFTVVNLWHGQTLKVSPRGWYPDTDLYASTRGSFPRAGTDPRAPAVNGQPAYWDGNGIMWQYAPGAWAYLYGAGNTQTSVGRTLDEQIAGKVRFGQSRPLYTPFRLTHGLPTGWQATETDSVMANGRLLVWQLRGRPGSQARRADHHEGHPRRDLRRPAAAAVHPDDGRDPVGLLLLLRPRGGSGRLRSEEHRWGLHEHVLLLARPRASAQPGQPGALDEVLRPGPGRLDHPADCRVVVPRVAAGHHRPHQSPESLENPAPVP